MTNAKKAFAQVKHLIAVVVFFIIAFCFAMFQGGFVSWFIFFVITPFVTYSLLLFLVPMKFTQATRTWSPSKVTSGDEVLMTITVERTNHFPLLFVLLQDDAQHEEPLLKRELLLGGFRKKFTWTYRLNELQRGEYQFQDIVITCYDFFGWISRKETAQTAQQLVVYPQVHKLRAATMQSQFERGTAQSPFALIKDTSMVTSVRNYQPGDRMSWIHWKSFAKTEQLRTKSFEDSQSQDLCIVMDLMAGEHFEASVSLSASLLQSFVKQQSEVVFMTTGAQRAMFPIIQTASQMEQVMRYLAMVQPEPMMSTYRQLATEPVLQQIQSLAYITTAFTREMEVFFQALNKQIICFVVQEEPQQAKTLRNLRVIYVQPAHFEQVLLEVAKR